MRQQFVFSPEAKSVFTINQQVVTKQSSDPQHIHKRRKVKQRAHLSLPLIIQDIISEKKWKLSKMGGGDITPTLCSTFEKKVVYTPHMLITFPLTIYGCRLNRDAKISDDKKGKKTLSAYQQSWFDSGGKKHLRISTVCHWRRQVVKHWGCDVTGVWCNRLIATIKETDKIDRITTTITVKYRCRRFKLFLHQRSLFINNIRNNEMW